MTALRTEYVAARAGARANVRVERCGMGPDRARRWVDCQATDDVAPLAIVGVAGALDPAIRSGDVIVATEVHDPNGRTLLRGGAPLAGALRRWGLRVHSGPMVSSAGLTKTRERAALHRDGAIAVDMESAPIAQAWADRAPVAVVRVVVDTVHTGVYRPATVPNGVRALLTIRRLLPAVEEWAALAGEREILLAAPRSFCAGVERAIEVVDRALAQRPHPVYVRRQIVHNRHVVHDLEKRGAVFVDELDQVPDGTTVVFSAHGVAQRVRDEAERRHMEVIDATCPLVSKVHSEAQRFSRLGYTVLLLGHAGHDETEGTLGATDTPIQLVQTPDDVERILAPDPQRVACVTQTTLALDEVSVLLAAVRRRFPAVQTPATEDICFATTNRQQSVRAIAAESDVVIVLGSANSSNSQRLVEVAERSGTPAHLVDDATSLLPEWLDGARVVGITAGASAPPHLVDEVIDTLRAFGTVTVTERRVAQETVHFSLPKEVAD